MIHATLDPSDYSVTADKLYTEIVAAVKAGCAPVLPLTAIGNDFYLVPLVMAMEETLVFQVYTGDALMGVSCTVDNEWALMPLE